MFDCLTSTTQLLYSCSAHVKFQVFLLDVVYFLNGDNWSLRKQLEGSGQIGFRHAEPSVVWIFVLTDQSANADGNDCVYACMYMSCNMHASQIPNREVAAVSILPSQDCALACAFWAWAPLSPVSDWAQLSFQNRRRCSGCCRRSCATLCNVALLLSSPAPTLLST